MAVIFGLVGRPPDLEDLGDLAPPSQYERLAKEMRAFFTKFDRFIPVRPNNIRHIGNLTVIAGLAAINTPATSAELKMGIAFFGTILGYVGTGIVNRNATWLA